MLLALNRFHGMVVFCCLPCNPVNEMIRKKLKQDVLRSIDWG